jgi:hypothetical protein
MPLSHAPLKDALFGVFSDVKSVIASNTWIKWFSQLVDFTPYINQGVGAPGSLPIPLIPNKVGDIYCDTSGGKVYIATGKTTSADWKILN